MSTRSKWAIAAVFPGLEHLYYARLPGHPLGSISLCRRDSKSEFFQPITYDTEQTAQSVLKVIIEVKKLSSNFIWKVVPFEEVI